MVVTPGHSFLEIEKAYQERESGLILLKVNPRWDPLRATTLASKTCRGGLTWSLRGCHER